MRVTDKGQVTIPKHIRTAAGVAPGSEVRFSLEGSRIVVTPVAGAVRDDHGRVLADATTLRIGLATDRGTTSHPVVDGIAIVDAWVAPEATIHADWDQPPPVEGQILGKDGRVLSICRA